MRSSSPTSLAVIVGSASGGFAGAIVLYETALGVGIATGPLLGGFLGNFSWRGPFFGVSTLMLIALVATLILVPRTAPAPAKSKISEPLRALKHRNLATTSTPACCTTGDSSPSWGTPLPHESVAAGLGAVFCRWGVLVALFAVFGAPFLRSRFGTPNTLYVSLGIRRHHAGDWDLAGAPVAVIGATIAVGICMGVNNTLVTTAVMTSLRCPARSPRVATYGFVRFIGGGLAPFFAGKHGRRTSTPTCRSSSARCTIVSGCPRGAQPCTAPLDRRRYRGNSSRARHRNAARRRGRPSGRSPASLKRPSSPRRRSKRTSG